MKKQDSRTKKVKTPASRKFHRKGPSGWRPPIAQHIADETESGRDLGEATATGCSQPTALTETEESCADLYARGLLCDSGVRRGGEIAWVAQLGCDRCAGGMAAPNQAPDRLPCDESLRTEERARAAMLNNRALPPGVEGEGPEIEKRDPTGGKRPPAPESDSGSREQTPEETPPEGVIALSAHRLPRVWRRALDLLIEKHAPAPRREECPPGGFPPGVELQLPAAELFSKIMAKHGRVNDMQSIGAYLREKHKLEKPYIDSIYHTYFLIRAAHVDCFWDDGIYDHVGNGGK